MNAKPSATALPLLVTPTGSVLRDSWEIAASTPLEPCPAPLREVLDRELGTAGRKFIYNFILKPQHAKAFTTACTEGRHWLWRVAWHCGLGGALRARLSAVFGVGDAAGLAECVRQLDALLTSGALVDALEARKGPFLGGAELGAADLALASFAALCVLPEEYGGKGGTMAPHFAKLLSSDAVLRGHVERWRGTAVGAYAMLVYKTQRL